MQQIIFLYSRKYGDGKLFMVRAVFVAIVLSMKICRRIHGSPHQKAC